MNLAALSTALHRAGNLVDRIGSRNSPRVKVSSERLTYLEPNALRLLEDRVRHIEAAKVPGCILEMGCALGGSAIVICAAKDPSRPFYVYDVFGMIPAPSEKDGQDVHRRYEVIRSGQSKGIHGDEYYGYRQDLKEQVTASFERYGLPLSEHNVSLVQGLYQDTLNPPGAVAFAHVDCDWYESVTVCLERIAPKLSVGGSIVVDDYFSYSGCRAAVWDYFRGRLEEFAIEYRERLVIRRIV